MEIRRFNSSDIINIINGEEKYFKESLGADFLNFELTNPFAYYLVAYENEKFLGYLGAHIDIYSEILNFFVEDFYRKNGLGIKLLNEVINYAYNSESKMISLEVRASNIPAISLYEKAGFIKSHIRKSYYKDGEDAILMIKNLE